MFGRKKNQQKQAAQQPVQAEPVRAPRPAPKAQQIQIPPEVTRMIRAFKDRISEEEDLLYGVALFFEGANLLFAGQDAVIETYRKHCRNIIQQGSDNLQRAQTLAAQVKSNPVLAPQLEQFKFMGFTGQTDLEEMAGRAEILMQAYNKLFPGRSRAEPFKPEEILKIMDEASSQ